MFNKPKNIPPEPYFSGYMEFLYRVFIWLRVHSGRWDKMTEEELRRAMKDIHVLSDALHNVPAFLREMDDWFTPEKMREIYIAGYDEKLEGDKKKFFELLKLLDNSIDEAKKHTKK